MAENSKYGVRLAFLLAGSAIGATIGLLFAPKAGSETRETIASRVKEGSEALSEGVKTAQEQISKAREKVGAGAQQFLRKGRSAIGREEDVVAAAIDAAKQAYLEEKESWELRHS